MVRIGHRFIAVQAAQLGHQQIGMRMGHHVVHRRAQHVGGRGERRRILDRFEAVAQHVLDRHRAELALGNGQDRVVRRDQHQRMHRPLERHLHGHPGTEAASHHRHLGRVDVMARGQPVEQQAAVLDHVQFGRVSLRIAIAAVIDGQHRHAGEQLAGVAHHPRHFLRPAAKIHHGGVRAHHLRRHQPAGQLGAVGSAQHDLARAMAAAARLVDFALDGRVEHQAPLAGGDGGGHAQPQHAEHAGNPCRFSRIVHRSNINLSWRRTICAASPKCQLCRRRRRPTTGS